MRHDLRDPHRVTRHAACAFWLHLLAAPAIVNTAAFTLYASSGATATAGLIVFLLAMTAVALVIDRRSFLLSGIGYVRCSPLTKFAMVANADNAVRSRHYLAHGNLWGAAS